MMKQKFLIAGVIAFYSLFFGTAFGYVGYVASSTNYRIESDSINFAGGFSSSTNYNLEDTAGEIASGDSDSVNKIRAGYQAMRNASYLDLSGPSNISLSGTISGSSGGQAEGQGVWSVVTDNSAGYSLAIRSSANPALVSGANSFANFSGTVASPSFAWSVATDQASFGFSVKGGDIVSSLKDNGSVCGTGSLQTANSCWSGLSTSDQIIAQSSGENTPSGSDTTIKFRAEAGATKSQPQGDYTATVIVTATAL